MRSEGYYLFWLFLIGISLLTSLGGFLWAYRRGQFEEQDRACYLPLRDETMARPEQNRRATSATYAVLSAVILLGMAALTVAVVIVILKA